MTRHTKRGGLDEGVYRMATNDVMSGKGLRGTANFYGINHTTLYYRVRAAKKLREDILGKTVVIMY